MAQHWGDAYFHFVVENLARITFMLDVLRSNTDIKVTPLFKNTSRRQAHPVSRLVLAAVKLQYVSIPAPPI